MNHRVAGHTGVTTLISGGHFLSHLYLLAFPPLFPLLASDFHVSITTLGVSISLIYLAQLLCQIPAGELVDRSGAKWVLVGGLFLTGLSMMLAGFTHSYLWFLGFAFLSGVGQSPFHPADYALLDAAGDESGEGKRFSIHSFSGFVGFAAAPGIVSGLAVLFGWHLALVAIGAVGIVYAGVLAAELAPVHRMNLGMMDSATTDESNDSISGFASIGLLKQPLVAGMFVVFLVVTIADTGLQTFTTAFAVQGLGFSPIVGNTALTAFLGVTAVFVLVGGWLADHFDAFQIIGWGFAGSALTLWAGLAVDLNQISMVAVWGAAGIGFGIALPARDRITNTLSTDASTGASFGIVYTGLTIGGVVAPVVIGWIINSATIELGIAAIGACFLGSAGLILVLLAYRHTQTGTRAQSSPGD